MPLDPATARRIPDAVDANFFRPDRLSRRPRALPVAAHPGGAPSSAGHPVLNHGCLAERTHGVDERSSLDSLRRTTGVIALFVAEWCGLEDAG